MDWQSADRLPACARTRPGQQLAWGECGGTYGPPADVDWQLLAGDITALPAIGRIVEELPEGAKAVVVAETFDEADRQEWETKGDVRVVWIPAHRNREADALARAALGLTTPRPVAPRHKKRR